MSRGWPSSAHTRQSVWWQLRNKGVRSGRQLPLWQPLARLHPPSGRRLRPRRYEEVEGTSGAAGLRSVRALRWSAALIAGVASAALRGKPVLALRVTAHRVVLRRTLQVQRKLGSDMKCPSESFGGKSSTSRWRLGRCRIFTVQHPLRMVTLGRSSAFGLAPPHKLRRFRPSQPKRVFNTSRLCSRFQLVAEVVRHGMAFTLR